MTTLSPALRKQLESTVRAARTIADEAAADAVARLAIAAARPPAYLSEDQKALRRRLRAHARSLGDKLHADETMTTARLAEAAAYEHWHRMLFGRFLVERNLLIHPTLGVPISRGDLKELSEEEGFADEWALVERFAAPSLPAVFKPDDPVLNLALDPHFQNRLRALVTALPEEVFTADDSLGWTYQFWRAAGEEGGQRSAGEDRCRRIAGRDAALHRALHGEVPAAQHARRVVGGKGAGGTAGPRARRGGRGRVARGVARCRASSGIICGSSREGRDGTVAAGGGYVPGLAAACGGDHLSRPVLRQRAFPDRGVRAFSRHCGGRRKGCRRRKPRARCCATICTGWKSTAAACRSPRSTWRWRPGAFAGGQMTLPVPHIAWVGAPPPLPKSEFVALANGDAELQRGLAALHDLFRQAPLLGSLIELTGGDLVDPTRIARLDQSIGHVSRKDARRRAGAGGRRARRAWHG